MTDKAPQHSTEAEDTFGLPTKKPQPARHHSLGPDGIGIIIGIGILFLLIGSVAGFAASRIVGRGDVDDRPGMFMNRRMDGGGVSRHMMGGTVGKVTSVSSSSITLTDNRSGGSVTFKIDSNTDINDSKGDNAKVSDIKVGDTVSVRGTSATDDTTADTIVINPTGY